MAKKQGGFGVVEVIIFILIVATLVYASLYFYNSQRHDHETHSAQKTNVTKLAKTVVAVGDVACDPEDTNSTTSGSENCQSDATYKVAVEAKPDAALLLGDLQYDNATLTKFKNSYDKNWGKLKSITYATAGNHEYTTKDAAGYYAYFNDVSKTGEPSKGYYSTNIGDWHILSLNSNCSEVGGCGVGSAQFDWLQKDLKSSSQMCTLAFWHHPHFTSGKYANDQAAKSLSKPFWDLLIKYKADVVLNGHDHLYERFATQNQDGQPTSSGIRQFTVGTGGKTHYQVVSKEPASEKVIDDKYGVLKLELYPKSYKWQLQSITSEILDSGLQRCNS